VLSRPEDRSADLSLWSERILVLTLSRRMAFLWNPHIRTTSFIGKTDAKALDF